MHKLFAIFFCLLTLGASANPLTEALEQQVLRGVNRVRKSQQIPAYRWDDKLATAARWHSQEMAQYNFFDHVNRYLPEHREMEDRVSAAGEADTNGLAENIHWCRRLPQDKVAGDAVTSWLESPGHRQNLLSRAHKRIGVGVEQRGEEFWVTVVLSD